MSAAYNMICDRLSHISIYLFLLFLFLVYKDLLPNFTISMSMCINRRRSTQLNQHENIAPVTTTLPTSQITLIQGLFGLKDFYRNIGRFQSLGFFPKEVLWIKGMTPPKFLWIAFLHPNPIGISTSNLTSFLHSFA